MGICPALDRITENKYSSFMWVITTNKHPNNLRVWWNAESMKIIVQWFGVYKISSSETLWVGKIVELGW